MDVVLFNSSTIGSKEDVIEMSGAYPRIGIASIAAYLLEHGVDVRIVDPELKKLSIEDIKKEISKFNPAIVGLPAYTEEIHNAAIIAEAVKEFSPDTITVVGGPHPSAIPIETLEEFESFDIAVVGEGEITLNEIASGKDLKNIQGIAYRINGEIKRNVDREPISNLDEMPFPAWQLYDLNEYRGRSLASGFGKNENSLELPVEGARGCPSNCSFCFRLAGNKIRFKSTKKVVDDIERCIKKFGANKIYFTEGTFGVKKKFAFELCNIIIERGLNNSVTWSTGARVDIDIDLLRKMKEAGCNFIGFGVESGDSDILKGVGKNISPEQSIKIFEICKKIGIKTEANFILGLPYETKETAMKTIKLASKLKADYANFAILVPFPGTKVYEMALKNEAGLKIKSKDWRMYGKQMGEALESENLTYKELKKLQMKAYRSFYLKPSNIGALLRRLSYNRIIYILKYFLENNKIAIQK